MLSSQQSHRYHQFQQQLVALSQRLATNQADFTQLKSAIAELNFFFQSELASLDLAVLAPELAHFILSYQVEIDKQLRLLAVDASFLQAARQTVTVRQRQQQIRDRLSTLQRYCEAVLSRSQVGEEPT